MFIEVFLVGDCYRNYIRIYSRPLGSGWGSYSSICGYNYLVSAGATIPTTRYCGCKRQGIV